MTSKIHSGREPLSLVWLRRDLRLHDHAALAQALESHGAVQPVFVFDTAILKSFANPQDKRVTFIVQTLSALHQQLKPYGGGVLCLLGDARDAIPAAAQALWADRVVCEEDYEPETIKRDVAVKQALSAGCAFEQVVDHVVMRPSEVVKDDGTPYRVFTPYSKAWRAALSSSRLAEKRVELRGRLSAFACVRDAAMACDALRVIDLDAGVEAALEQVGYRLAELGEWGVDDVPSRLTYFVDHHLSDYKDQRDYLSVPGTSKLSPYLRFGLISVRECARLAAHQPSKGSDCWINELIWREFYAMILYHFPDVVTLEFQEKYRARLPWSQNEEVLVRFKEGRTGFPVVDAAMRQLLHTGWMHNRARMIVASFMTKDLHLDWRLGEAHFGQYLMDYDLASNNGGWQWAASTGTDAQPYFRVFNPVLQSERFDPKGDYIRRWVPELADVDTRFIHAPNLASDLFSASGYPKPMVDHATAKAQAIAMFKVGEDMDLKAGAS